jgi:hypothetical protein
MKRIINGTEVLLTPESVDALQHIPQTDPSVGPTSGDMVVQYDMDGLNGSLGLFRAPPTFYPTIAQTLSSSGLIPGADPWFLGGLDPFSSTPYIRGSPIRPEWLISHCKRSQSLAV